MGSVDALAVFRRAIRTKSEITYSNAEGSTSTLATATHLVVPPGLKILKTTPTRYRRRGVSSSNPEDFFTAEAIYLAWLLKDAPSAAYMKQARESGLAAGFVGVTERKSVVDWLEGVNNDNQNVVPAAESTTPPDSPPRSSLIKSGPDALSDPTSPTKRRYIPDAQDIEVVKRIKQNEIELQDRNTVLRGSKPNNFSSIRTVYAETLRKIKEAGKAGASSAAAASTDSKMQARKARNMFPIIMVSSSPTALITMHNVKRFLQEASFEPSQEARARAAAEGNARTDDLIPVDRKRTVIDSSGKETHTVVRYFIVDSVEALSKFGSDAWDRVVCVMTTGQAWQFRPYKWNEPIQLFHHVKGFYVSWSNDPPNTKIKDWNVTELKIDPLRRHVDKSVVAHFWKTLDTWTVTNKPWLMKS